MSLLALLLAGSPVLPQPVSALEDSVPVEVINPGRCTFHLELLALKTGATRAQTKHWSTLLGELGDGSLVVTNQRVAGAKTLRVAVLSRFTLKPIFTCDSTLSLQETTVAWWVDGTEVVLERVAAKTAPLLLELELQSDHCELKPSRRTGRPQAARVLEGKVDLWVDDLHLTASNASGSASLQRGSTRVWRRELSPLEISCVPGDTLR